MRLVSWFKKGIVLFSLVVLIGCGGSGGGSKKASSSSAPHLANSSVISSHSTSSSSSSNSSVISSAASSESSVALIEQIFGFNMVGPVIKREHSELFNAASGQGSGAIQYRSSDKDIAKVDAKGVVTINAVGSVTITATIAADDKYLEATASYVINVIPRKVPVNVWIGEDDSLVDFPAGIVDYEFYRTTQFTCDISAFSLCADGNFSILDGETVLDTTLNLDRDAIYTLKLGDYSDYFFIGSSDLETRVIEDDDKHDVVVHDDKMWRFTKGTLGSLSRHALWSSINGIDWEEFEISKLSHDVERDFFNAISFNNKLWMIGGNNSFSSDDAIVYWANPTESGIEWVAVETNNIFSRRNHHQSVVFNGKLWVIGGNEGSASTRIKNDIWSSEDGLEWVEESASAAFSAREGHQVVVFNNKLWLIGGYGYGEEPKAELKNDVWSSADGVTWVQEVAEAEFRPRDRHQVVSFKGKLWLIGGRGTLVGKDIWTSVDGVQWVNEVKDAVFSRREFHQMVVFEDKLFLIGGGPTPDVWMTVDGVNWRQAYKGEFHFLEMMPE